MKQKDHLFLERIKTEGSCGPKDGYATLLLGYAHSAFQHFDRFIRTELSLPEDHLQMTWKKYNSKFIVFTLPAGIYTFEGLSLTLRVPSEMVSEDDLAKRSRNSSIQSEIDDLKMETKLTVGIFSWSIGAV